MINLLYGSFHDGRNGYELPPHFDFVHFPIKPFQMIVVPISHELSKAELIDIYQGVMPDASFVAEKARARSKLQTRLTIPQGIKPSWMPLLNPDAESTQDSIAVTNPHSFLHPGFLDARINFSEFINENFSSMPYNTPKEFYQDLKFLVFKVKERANKDYESYKRRQIEMVALNQAINNVEEENALIRVSDNSILKTSKQYSDIVGYNWPYDNFSLFEKIKIDMSIEVDR